MIRNLFFAAFIFAAFASVNAQVWTQQNTAFTDLTTAIGVDQVVVVDENVVWVKGFNGSGSGTDLKIFSRTNNGGSTWTAGHFTQLGATEMPYVLGASSYLNAYVIVMDTVSYATSMWATSDGGTTWVKKTAMFAGGTSFADGVRFWDAQRGISYGDPVSGIFEIYTTTDGGLNWTPNANAPAPNPANEYGFNGFECMALVPGGIGFIMTDHGRVLKTTDYGASWTTTATAPFTSSAYNGNKVYASSANYIICAVYTTSSNTWQWKYTSDGGQTWNTYAPAAPFYSYAMCYVPGTTNMFVATSPDINTIMGVAYSQDGGQTWTDYTDALLQPAGSNIQCLGVGFFSQQTGWVGNYDQGGTINSILKYHDVTAGENILNYVNGNDVNMYPNPSNGKVWFSVNGPVKEDISVAIYDLTGRLIYNETLNTSGTATAVCDLSGQAPGLYFVHLRSGNDLKTEKLIIR